MQSERGTVKFSKPMSPAFSQATSNLLRKSLDIGFDEVVDIDHLFLPGLISPLRRDTACVLSVKY